MISTRHLVVKRGSTTIIDGVELDVQAGGWVAVVGPNGAGKSTLLHALAGIVASEGDVLLDGTPIGGMRRREVARHVALVPQIPVVPEGLRVVEYLVLGRTPHLGRLGVEGRRDHALVAEVAERLDLTWALPRVVTTLSGGELQRVVVARALVQEPQVLLLDEPTTGLDLAQQHHVLEAVAERRLAMGLTVVSAMHDLSVASRFADGIVMLRRGRIVAAGAPSAVLREDLIGELYGTAVRVIAIEGGRVVVPVRDAAPRAAAQQVGTT